MKYRKGEGFTLPKGQRNVLSWEDAAHFRCPCDERTVNVQSPPHSISFDDEGLLTLDGSCGSKVNEALGRPTKNWCHFWIKAGVPEMCEDAKCPGNGRD